MHRVEFDSDSLDRFKPAEALEPLQQGGAAAEIESGLADIERSHSVPRRSRSRRVRCSETIPRATEPDDW